MFREIKGFLTTDLQSGGHPRGATAKFILSGVSLALALGEGSGSPELSGDEMGDGNIRTLAEWNKGMG